jgi:beta-mannanase
MRRLVAVLFALAGFAAAAPPPPSNPNTTPEARKVLTYLQNLGGQGILSGQLSMLNDTVVTTDTLVTTFRDRYVMRRNGGKLPAVYASNFGDWPMDYQHAIVKLVKDRWKATQGKSVALICWHTVQPDTNEELGYAAMSKFSASNPYPAAKVDSILTPGTRLNIEHMRRLKVAGTYLKSLDSAGIPVLWRPYHENNGAFFWWGQQPRFKELWAQMYNYYTDSLKLNNLIWVYSMCHFGEGDRWIDSLYPGHKYVDMLGVDIYAGNFGQGYDPWIYATLLTKAEGRPIGITENGVMPHVPTLKSTQPKWSLFATWWGYEVDTLWKNAYYHPDGFSIQNPDSLYTANYGDPYTITADEIDWSLPAGTNVFLSTGVSPKGSGRVITAPDSAGRFHAGQILTITAEPSPGWVFAGWSGGASGTANPLPLALASDKSLIATFIPLKGTNLLLNGSFSQGLADWSFSAWQTNAKASATVETADSTFHSLVTGTSADPWGTQLTQGLLLDSGTTYEISFRLRGDAGAKISYGVGESSGQWRKLWTGADTLGASAIAVRDTFVDTLPSASALRLEFNLGAQNGNLWLDDIRIARISGTDPVITQIQRRRRDLSGWVLHAVPGGLEWIADRPATEGAQLRVRRLDGTLAAAYRLPTGARSGRIPCRHGAFLIQFPDGSSTRVVAVP